MVTTDPEALTPLEAVRQYAEYIRLDQLIMLANGVDEMDAAAMARDAYRRSHPALDALLREIEKEGRNG